MPRVSTTAIIIGFSLGLLLGAPSAPAFAGPPAEQLASQIDRVLAVLDDPAFKGDEHVGPRRQAVRRVTDELIDWDEMGRRTLGARWQTLDDGERHAFVALFSELLNRAYLRNLDRYEGEKIVVTGDSVDGDRAVVRAKVVKNEGEGRFLAQLRAERHLCQQRTFWGATDCARFRVGHSFELQDHDEPSNDGEYLITSIELGRVAWA